jgi:quercetin dioxygenase-like cupin family protein
MERRAVEHRSRVGAHGVRESHDLSAPLLCFDFAEEIEGLRRERQYLEHDRNAKTLVKTDAFRIVLVVLKAGARFDEDDPRGHVSALVRSGRVSFHVGDESTEVGTGQIAAVAAGHRWRALAAEDSVVVLHFSWPG